MSFWGMSQTGKDAQKNMRDIGAMSMQELRDWLARQNEYSGRGNALNDLLTQYYQDQMGNGFGTPGQIRGIGQDIMPGLDELLSRREGRLQTIRDRFNELRPGTDTMGQINANTDEMGRLIGSTSDDIGNEINSGYGRMSDRAGQTFGDMLKNTQGTYGALRGNLGNVYGDLRSDNSRTFGDLLASGEKTFGDLMGSSDKTFDQTGATLEQLKPGGEFQAARVARSFAPQLAATMGRIRRAGIDPNSPQAAALIGMAETARARGMDDASANAIEKYVMQKNQLDLLRQASRENLGLGREGVRQNLNLGRMSGERGLRTDQSGQETALGREEGNIYRDLTGGNLAEQQRLDQARQAGIIGNAADYRDLSNQYFNQRNANEIMGRNLGLQDWQLGSDLERERNAEELTGQGLRNEQFDRGFGFRQADLGARNQAAGGMGNLMNTQYQNMFGASNQARGWGGDAYNANNQIYQQEAANAGWGKKLLGGLGMAALNFIPGAGIASQIARGVGGAAIGGLTGSGGGNYGGGFTGGYGYGGYGGYRTPPFLPSGDNGWSMRAQGSPSFNSRGQLQYPGASGMEQATTGRTLDPYANAVPRSMNRNRFQNYRFF